MFPLNNVKLVRLLDIYKEINSKSYFIGCPINYIKTELDMCELDCKKECPYRYEKWNDIKNTCQCPPGMDQKSRKDCGRNSSITGHNYS